MFYLSQWSLSCSGRLSLHSTSEQRDLSKRQKRVLVRYLVKRFEPLVEQLLDRALQCKELSALSVPQSTLRTLLFPLTSSPTFPLASHVELSRPLSEPTTSPDGYQSPRTGLQGAASE